MEENAKNEEIVVQSFNQPTEQPIEQSIEQESVEVGSDSPESDLDGSQYSIENKIIFPNVVSTTQLEIDNEKLQEYIYSLQEIDSAGRTVSNRGGWQSPDIDPHAPELKDFINELLSVTEAVATELHLENLVLSNLWFNVNGPHSYNQTHAHPGAILSGTYYVKKPEHSGSLEFMRADGGEHLNTENRKSFFTDSWAVFEATEGTLVLFPGWLKHSVGPNLTFEDRISISFNFS